MLSRKQAAFVAEYLRDFNATQAAIRSGYSKKTAGAIGHQNLKNIEIQAEISRLVEENSMGKDEVLLRLADHARGDMGDFLDITPMGFVIDLHKAQSKGLTHLIKRVKVRTQTSVNKDGTETETFDAEIELYDAQTALVNIGRHHALFTDKQDISKRVYNVNIVDEDESDDE